ncbi:L-histidine N(alpha)-methyltransferase [Prosthecochloris sp.]|uniref:L-histidine N(alpha)-methyltransferase n=1 Tax=Prosthecochloris sp. TaxID=290513 RepID=UPI00338E5216
MKGQQVFIGSSNERRPLARKIVTELEALSLSVLPWWDKRAFRATDITLPRLIQLANLCEAAVLVFGGDDKIWFRPDPTANRKKKPNLAVRDNVLLEYGLFVGLAGLRHTVIVAEHGVKLPSDLNGVTVIYFSQKDSLKSIADRVGEYFSGLLQDDLESSKFSDSSMAIRTDWRLEMHRVHDRKAASSAWNPANLYVGMDGALAWSKVETDPAYSNRTQTNLNGHQIATLIGNHSVSTIVSLGPGLGTVDAELIANLKVKKLQEYVPVDINHFLITKSAENVAAKNPWVECKHGILCDFDQNTSFIGQIISKHCPGPRLFLMAGGTFGNSTRTEQSLLGSLYQVMNHGDIFVFDLFCYGSMYDVNADPMFDFGQWPLAVKKFFVNGVRQFTGDHRISENSALQRLIVTQKKGLSGLPNTTTISFRYASSGISLVDIRRFDATEITNAIRSAGFCIT